MRSTARSFLRRYGYEIVSRSSPLVGTDDLEPEFAELYAECKAFTMTSLPRMYALYQAVLHIESASVPGAFVECGVWKGGSAMLAARTLLRRGSSERELVLYDTFAGMPQPDQIDVDHQDRPASLIWDRLQRDGGSDWCYAPLEEVQANLAATAYPADRIRLVEGLVEETIPTAVPGEIAILRLDTDWYESTYHELVHLFPRLSRNGVLIVDDYGYWKGQRRAVDEYLGRNKIKIFLHRIDSAGRIGLKT